MKIFADLEKFPLLSKQQKNYSTNTNARSKLPAKESVRGSPGHDLRRVSILRLFEYTTKWDKCVLCIGVLCVLAHGCAMPALSLVFGKMTDTFMQLKVHGFFNESDFTNNRTTDSLTTAEFTGYMEQYVLEYIYISIAVLLSGILQALCWEWTCERQILRMRQAFLYQVLRQEMYWFEHENRCGSLTIKLADDLERIREGIGYHFSMFLEFLTAFMAGCGVGLYTNWQLTLMIMSTIPLMALASAVTGKLLFTQTTRERHKYGMAGAVAEEVLSCIKTVQSLGGEQREINRYEKSLNEGLEIAIKKYHYLALGIGVVFFLMFASNGLAFWFGCQLLSSDLVTAGEIFTVFTAVLFGGFALGSCVPSITKVLMARASAAVVFEIIDAMPESIDPYSKAGLKLNRVVGKIQFQNLSFSYPSRNEVSVLQNFNLDIEPGKTIAIVGASGSGKSTIVNLILRFYDPNAGEILLDGHEITNLNLAWYRNQIGVVSQEPVIFDTSIYENIRYGKEDVSPEEIVAAARVSGAHEFISTLPSGYETITGERGAQLSGGQKQRIAIARALVRNPKILILDEATSALDAKSEAAVHTALDEAWHGRTTVIIAHRLSTIKNADVIYTLKDGAIFESGTHAQLMAKEGLYYHLATSQTTIDAVVNYSGDASVSYDSNDEDSTKEFFDNDRRFKRKIRNEKKKFQTAYPDPDKARLFKEAKELNVVPPGKFRILRANRPEWLLLTGGTVGSIMAAFVMPFFGFSHAGMFESLSFEGTELESAAIFWAFIFLLMGILSGLGSWLRTILIGAAGEVLTKRLRLQSYIAVVRQPLAWFDQDINSPGRITTRLARDAPLVKGMAGNWLSAAIATFVITILGLMISFWAGWQLTLVLLAASPILVIAGYNQLLLQKPGQKKYLQMIEDAGRVATEAIHNIKTVQALSIESLIYDQYLQHLKEISVEVHKQALKFGLTFACSESVSYFLYAVAFYYGGYLIGHNIMDSTDVYRVFFCVFFSAMSAGQSASLVPEHTKANLAAGLIFNLIETKSTIDPLDPEGLRPVLTGRVTFSNVVFNYPSRKEVPVLQGLSFDLQPGSTLALVGVSGVGKSTVVSLLERFYDVTDGRITVDGFDIRSLQVAHLRSIIGLVTQEPVLFNYSIRDNIAYGYGDAMTELSDGRIVEAAVAANCHEFIASLPLGYETLVGDRGTQISGGQKQRIAIARALVRNPRILLLDEATSALDTESELIVQEALDNARMGRTCIIIAHRLSTIQNADCIAVMSHGRIVEMGTHDQLIKARKIYYKLTKKQQITH